MIAELQEVIVKAWVGHARMMSGVVTASGVSLPEVGILKAR